MRVGHPGYGAGMASDAAPVGRWRVERTGGPIPLLGVTKRIDGSRGRTCVLGVPVGVFRVDGTRLVYRGWPLVDEVEQAPDGTWHGRGLVLGRLELVRFRLVAEGETE